MCLVLWLDWLLDTASDDMLSHAHSPGRSKHSASDVGAGVLVGRSVPLPSMPGIAIGEIKKRLPPEFKEGYESQVETGRVGSRRIALLCGSFLVGYGSSWVEIGFQLRRQI